MTRETPVDAAPPRGIEAAAPADPRRRPAPAQYFKRPQKAGPETPQGRAEARETTQPLGTTRRESRESQRAATQMRLFEGEIVAFAALELDSLLAADLFRLQAAQRGRPPHLMAEDCRDQWHALARLIAAAPHAIEAMLIVTGASATSPARWRIVALGRAAQAAEALDASRQALDDLASSLRLSIDHATFRAVETEAELAQALGILDATHVTEISRRSVLAAPAASGRSAIGFGAAATAGAREEAPATLHLWPWVGGVDSWHPLLEQLGEGARPTSLVLHLRSTRVVPAELRAAARERTRADEATVATASEPLSDDARMGIVLRAESLEGPMLAARLFLAASVEPSSLLASTLENTLIHGANGAADPAIPARTCATREVAAREMLASLSSPDLDTLLTPAEATAVLRVPHPAESGQMGLPVTRSRTAPMIGVTGDDIPLGMNEHGGRREAVALDVPTRLRHVHVIGQTGTGKSTFLSRSIVHDIEAGRGVVLIDPHGMLIDEVLQHYPERRADDLVILDLGDADRPVGFNILHVPEQDPVRYRAERDLVIDELLAYCTRTHLREHMGPMFETHVRGMLGLLLGSNPQCAPFIPNLALLRKVYSSADLRKALRNTLSEDDFVLDEFIAEAEAVADREANIAAMSPYITSKFVRFFSDAALRNVTCQNRSLDIPALVGDGKVLLVNLAKGRVGEHAAGLIASQIVSRVWRAAMSRPAREADLFALYVDECQLVVDERFAEMLAEGRKFGLALTLAHQHAEQLPEKVLSAVLGNVGSMVVLRVGAKDAALLEHVMGPALADRDLAWMPNFHAAVRTCGPPGPLPFTVTLPPPPTGGSASRAASLRQLSRLRFGRNRAEVEAEIRATMAAYRGLRS